MDIFQKSRKVKLLFGVIVTLALFATFMAIVATCSSQQPEPTPLQTQTVLQTEIVTAMRTGTRTVIVENETGRQHTFTLTTTRHRRGTAPESQTRGHIETDILRIYSRGAVLVIFEVATQVIHII